MSVRRLAWALACTLAVVACDDGGGDSPAADASRDATIKKDRGAFMLPDGPATDSVVDEGTEDGAPDAARDGPPPDAAADAAGDAPLPDAEPDAPTPDVGVDLGPDVLPDEGLPPDEGPEPDLGPPPECEEADDCNDQDTCTIDGCRRGQCENERIVPCCSDDDDCDGTACVRGLRQCAAPSDPGVVVITEMMIDPEAVADPFGEWIELTNRSFRDVVLNGWVLAGTGGEAAVIDSRDGPVVVPPGGVYLLGSSRDRQRNGDIEVDFRWEFFSLNNESDRVSLFDANGGLVDEVVYGRGWPLEPGRAINLSGDRLDRLANDDPGSWCVAETERANGDFGTPRGANPICPIPNADTEVDNCMLVDPVEGRGLSGTTLRFLGQLTEIGITDRSPFVDADPNLRAEVGYGPDNSQPGPAWRWTDAEPDPDWSDRMGAANWDQYSAALQLPAPGTYDTAFRFSRDGGQTWRYCDRDGAGFNNAGALVSEDSPCALGPCFRPPPPRCLDAFTVQTLRQPGECSVADGNASCRYERSDSEDCGAGDRVCLDGACVESPEPRPGAGDVVFTELMYDPEGALPDDEAEWIEVQNVSRGAVRLDGCVVADSVSDQRIDRLVLPPQGIGLFARNGDPAVNGGLEPDVVFAFGLNNVGEAVSLRCGEVEIDRVVYEVGGQFPVARGRSIQLDRASRNGQANDDGANWCLAENAYFGEDTPDAHYGTPGETNPACGAQDVRVDFCRLQPPADVRANAGSVWTSMARVFEAGITDRSEATDRDERLVGQLGYGARGTLPAEADWSWFDGAPNPAWVDLAEPGADEYQQTVRVPAPGEYDFAWRFSRDDGMTWLYCDAEEGSANGYSPNSTGHLLSVPSPCQNEACEAPGDPFCDGDLLQRPGVPGACEVVDDAAECTYPNSPRDCSADGGRCVAGACGGGAPPPAAGEIVITEILYDPHGALAESTAEWFELRNITDGRRSLDGCSVGDGNASTVVVGLVMEAGAYAVFARSNDPALNGGLEPDALFDFGLANGGDTLRVRCNDTVIDQVTYDDGGAFPDARSRSIALDPERYDARENDNGARWCLGRDAYFDEGGPDAHYGTPGADNPACPPPVVDYCRLEAPVNAGIEIGDAFTALGVVLEPGVTDRSARVDAHPDLVGQAGYGPDGSVAGPAWSWFDAFPDGGWDGAAADEAESDRYTAEIQGPREAGDYDVAYRFSFDGGETWTYCDLGAGSDDGYRPADAGALRVSEPSDCEPNPCVRAPRARCVGDVRVSYARVGVCTDEGDTVSCAYDESRALCGADERCDDGACVPLGIPNPQAGDVVFSEVMYAPQGRLADADAEWFEVHNVTDEALSLHGCAVDDGETTTDIVGLVLAPGGYAVFGRSADRAVNGGVAVDHLFDFELADFGETLTMRCGNVAVDALDYTEGFPVTRSQSVQLDPDSYDADANDDGDAWCASERPYYDVDGELDDHFGTPGAANPRCAAAPPVDACRFQFPLAARVAAGDDLAVFGRVLARGITDRSPLTDPDDALVGRAGFGPPDSDPQGAGWRWIDATPNLDYDGEAAGEPDIDEYRADFAAPGVGLYDLAYRFSRDGGDTWTYCDADGSENGYDPEESGDLTVVAPATCNPNPCVNPPGAACDGDGVALRYSAPGECELADGIALCDYAADRVECGVGEACRRGACVEVAPAPLAGEVIFAEVMYDPRLPDSGAEWFELYNAGDRTVGLSECTVGNGGGGYTEIDGLVLRPGARALFARSDQGLRNGGLDPDHLFGFSLDNAGDLLGLRCGGTLVDLVSYDDGGDYPDAEGASLSLDPQRHDAAANDAGRSWCLGAAVYFDGHRGTPGEENPGCPDPCADNPCDDPPPTGCDPNGFTRLVYAGIGACRADGTAAVCEYAPRREACGGGQACVGGACIAAGDDLCEPNPCGVAPASVCTDERTRIDGIAPGACEEDGGRPVCEYRERGVDCGAARRCEDGRCTPAPDPCEPNPCAVPPGASCSPDGRSVVVTGAPGACTVVRGEPRCAFDQEEIRCDLGSLCLAGRCVAAGDDPCGPNPCQVPPRARCEGDASVRFSGPGACRAQGAAPDCAYESERVDCPGGCADGECIEDPCDPNPCDDAPDDGCSPDGRAVLAYQGAGECFGDGACRYVPEREPCEDDEICRGGQCAPVGEGVCDPNPCDSPPPERCGPDGVSRLVPADEGVCATAGGVPVCDYAARRVVCSGSDVCIGGACVAVGDDVCDPNPCAEAPSPACLDEVTAVRFQGPGACADEDGRPACAYEREQVQCVRGQVCRAGLCVDVGEDPCEPNPCDSPPAPRCDGATRVTAEAAGSCEDFDGQPVCQYRERRTPCPDGQVCRVGACVPAGADVCNPNPCEGVPAPRCRPNGATVVTFEGPSQCEAVDGAPSCTYGERETDCDPGDVCANGRCVDGGGDVCDPNPCREPPPVRCDGADRLVPAARGECIDADGDAVCAYPTDRVPCPDGLLCLGGECIRPDGDACDEDPCAEAPPPGCTPDAGARVVYEANGDCSEVDGRVACDHDSNEAACGDREVCLAGRCFDGGNDLCDPNPCREPPAARCDGGGRIVPRGPGLCIEADGRPVCEYEEAREACADGQVCVAGGCVDAGADVCDPNPCQGPPADHCADDGVTRITYEAGGFCREQDGEPVCNYLDIRIECDAGDVCLGGRCVDDGDDVCDPNPCRQAPGPECDGAVLVSFAAPGRCQDNGGRPGCDYPSERERCPDGQVCRGGACEDAGDDVCDPNPCGNAPADRCNAAGDAVVSFAAVGACVDEGGAPRCTYAPAEAACRRGEVCAGGRCVDEDPCDPDPCDNPPQDTCAPDGGSRLVYPRFGACRGDDGRAVCQYDPQRVACPADAAVCFDGDCVAAGVDPCDPNPCRNPAPPVCEVGGAARVVARAPGVCEDVDGEAECRYERVRQVCDEGETCVDGDCAAPPPNPCLPNPCDAPPVDTCDEAAVTVIDYPDIGECEVVLGRAACTYEPEASRCGNDEVCLDARCRPADGDPCDPNPCRNPPARRCDDLGGGVIVASAPGECVPGAGAPVCEYAEELQACDVGENCLEAQCRAPDLCDPNPCRQPPDARCGDDAVSVISFEGLGQCRPGDDAPECTYRRVVQACGEGRICRDAQCVDAGDDPCDPNPCVNPPDTFCNDDGDALIGFRQPGTCVADGDVPACRYERIVEGCGDQVCRNGECVAQPNACDPDPCGDAPAPNCAADGVTRVVFGGDGNCVDIEGRAICDFDEVRERCGGQQVCFDGDCVAPPPDPCEDIECDQAPQAECGPDGRSIVQFDRFGRCRVVGGDGVCEHDRELIACDDGEVCVDARCEFAGANVCDPNPCANAPAPQCEVGGGAVISFVEPGECADDEGQPRCNYVRQRVACGDGEVCLAGRCVAEPDDPCDPDPCNRPPPAECAQDPGARIVFGQNGECVNNNGQARCDYVGQRDECRRGEICRAGRCVDDGGNPCEPNPCVNAPEPGCNLAGNGKVEFSAPGRCAVEEGQAVCAFDGEEELCAFGEFCRAGDCAGNNVCDPNPCVDPPRDRCGADARTLVTFRAPGQCQADAQGLPECEYADDEAQCPDGEVCLNGGCVDAGDDPCDPNPCGQPPDPVCDVDRSGFRRFAEQGTCEVAGGAAECSYAAAHVNCNEDEECRDGECREPDPCVPNPCDDPPLPFCGFDGALVEPQRPGRCEALGGGVFCTYPERERDCGEGNACRFGECVEAAEDPCDPNPCDDPPASRCNGDATGVISFGDDGLCVADGEDFECQYFQNVVVCENNEVCIDAECQPLGDDVCDPNPCGSAPDPDCDQDGSRRVYRAPGNCEAGDDGRPACTYPFQAQACPDGQFCNLGRCQDNPQEVCNPNPCDDPPAATCTADARARLLPQAPGFCQDVDGEAQCDYFEQRELCEDVEVCINGACEPVGDDVCDPNPCQNRPRSECQDGQLRTFQIPGACEDIEGRPSCDYPSELADCDEGTFCRDGACLDENEACNPNPCNSPPVATCNEDGQLVTYEAVGECAVEAGEVVCDYPSAAADCDAGERCREGRCEIDPDQLEVPDEAGDLVINEIMYDTGAPLEDVNAEWFELYNASGAPLDLQGCTVGIVGRTTVVEGQLILGAGAYLLAGRSADINANGGLQPRIIFDFDLFDSGTTLQVVCDGVTIDAVRYDDAAPWPVPALRMALNLDPESRNAAANDDGRNWCLPDPEDRYYVDFQNDGHHLGTPGEANSDCPEPVDFCKLQFPLEVVAEGAGAETTYFGRYFHAGITDRSVGNDAHAGLRAQLGYGPDDSDPANAFGWQWFNATPTPDWDGGNFGEPDNDEYRAVVGAPFPGRYDFAFRFSVDAGRTFVYCDGGNGSSDGYQPANAGDLVVPQGGGGNPCDPNPCQVPPANDCDGNTARSFAAVGQCRVANAQAQCEYAVANTTNCAADGRICRGGQCAADVDEVDFCRYQHPPNANLTFGEQVTIYGRVFEPGITDRTAGTDVDQTLRAQGGFGPDGSDPDGNDEWEWLVADANLQYDGNAAGEPSNDEYEVLFNAPIPGQYDLAFRFSVDAGVSWVYCDGGLPGSTDGYQPANAGSMSVAP